MRELRSESFDGGSEWRGNLTRWEGRQEHQGEPLQRTGQQAFWRTPCACAHAAWTPPPLLSGKIHLPIFQSSFSSWNHLRLQVYTIIILLSEFPLFLYCVPHVAINSSQFSSHFWLSLWLTRGPSKTGTPTWFLIWILPSVWNKLQSQ